MIQAEAAAALKKVKALSPMKLVGVTDAELNLLGAGVLRWVEIPEPVFWVGIIDYFVPHMLLCHTLDDDGQRIKLRGIHGGSPFVCEIHYGRRIEADPVDVTQTLEKLVSAAEDERVIGPVESDAENETDEPIEPAPAVSGHIYL
jgi:hypothetical protein